MKSRYTRRNFIRNTTLGGAGLAILKNSRSAYGYPENETINLAIIGCGGRGRAFAQLDGCCALGRAKGIRVAFLCDVNEEKAAAAFRDFPEARKGNDYRVMLDKFNKEIDAAIVATGDYGHAPASAACIRAGKHVYCEKPLTVSVKEARMLAKLAAEHKVFTQMGNQGGYDPRAVNLTWSGMLGEVREVHCWMESRGVGRRPLPAGTYPVPRTLKWDLWLGPAPYRDYHPEWVRSHLMWREFGTSMMGNRFSHSGASVFKSLKIGELWPKNGATGKYQKGNPIIKFSGECSELCLYSFPRWEKAKWEVPARADMPPVTIHWYMGETQPFYEEQGLRKFLEDLLGRRMRWGDQTAKSPWGDFLGNLMIGSKSEIVTGGMANLGTDAENASKRYMETLANAPPPPNMLPTPLGTPGTGGFFDAIRGGPAPMCNFVDFSGPYIEFQLLVHVATLFPGEELEFDPVSCSIVNNSLADAALRRQYRPGWGMEEAG